MSFKKWKYNLIALFLVAIIGCYVGFSVVKQDAIQQETEAEDPIQGGGDEIIDPDISGDDEVVDSDISFEDMDKLELVNYSLNQVYYGEGFLATMTQTAVTTTTALGAKIVATQYVDGIFTKNKEASLGEYYYYFDANKTPSLAMDSMQSNYEFRYLSGDNFVGGTTNTFNRTDKTYDLSTGTITTMTRAEAYNKFKYLDSETLNICKGGSEQSLIPKKSYKIMRATDKSNYRQIDVTFDTSQLDEDFKQAFGATGQLQNISYNSLKITFKINLKNGKLLSMVLNEQINAKALGFDTSIEAKTTYTFKSVNKEQEIVCPSK